MGKTSVAASIGLLVLACSSKERPFDSAGDASADAPAGGSGGSSQDSGSGGAMDGSMGGADAGDAGPCPVNDPAPGCQAVQVSTGADNSCAVISDGTVRCWGANDYGQLGIGTTDTDPHGLPVAVPGLTKITKVAVGSQYACAVSSDNELFCWGRNAIGQLGIGTDADKRAPEKVALTNVIDVATAPTTTCALRTGGAVFCWGENAGGALGINDTLTPPDTCFDQVQRDCHLSPRPVVGLGANVTAISGGLSGHFAISGGELAYWGLFILGADPASVSGNCGYPCTNYPATIDVLGATPVQAAALGSYSFGCALVNGQAACAGSNSSGELGQGSTMPSMSPTFVAVQGGLSAAQVAVGYSNACLVTTSDELYCWGKNDKLQIGVDGAPATVPSPTRVSSLGPVAEVAPGGDHTCALLKDGGVSCWGDNTHGQLGLGSGDVTSRSTPQPVLIP